MTAWVTFASAIAIELPKPVGETLDLIRGYGWEDLVWSAFVACASYAVGRLSAKLALRLVARWFRHTKNDVDNRILDNVKRPVAWLAPIIVVRLALPIASIPEGIYEWVRHGLVIAAIIGAAWVAHATIRSVEVFIAAKLDLSGEEGLRARELATSTRGLRNVADFAVFVVTIGLVLMTFDSVRQIGSTVLASAGVAGLVIGFAAQKSIATVLAGIQIAITQPIRVEDVVVVEGEWGRIEEITLTYVVVRLSDLRRLIVPISYFLDKSFQNWTRGSPELLGTVELQLDFSVPVDELRAELTRIVEASPKWDKSVCNLQVTAANDRTMTVRPLFSAANSSDQWDLRCEVRERLIAFVNQRYPQALPRVRADLGEAPATGASGGGLEPASRPS